MRGFSRLSTNLDWRYFERYRERQYSWQNRGVENFQPYIGQLTFGGVAGFATGFAIKKVGRVVAIVVGILFIIVQLLASAGYISVDWVRIQKDVEPMLGQENIKNVWQGLLALLTHNLPFGASFTVGLALGLKFG